MRWALGDKLIFARQRYEQLKRRFSANDRRQEANFGRLRAAFFDRFWREAARNIGAEIEWLGYGFFRITKAGKWTLVYDSKVMLDDHVTMEMLGNKPLTHRLLQETDCPSPQFIEYDLSSLGKARDFLRSLRSSAVVKPAFGTGGGLGVTTKVCDEERLKRASWYASCFHRSLLIEEEIPGHSYRLLYLNGKLIDAVRRDPPTVTGDGKRSIRQLMEDETGQRLRDTSAFRALSPLSLDLACVFYLREQGLTPAAIPGIQQQIVVKSVINQNSRSENHCVREKIHSSIEELGSRLVTSLGIRLAGLDLIATEIGIPLKESGGVINEINSPPGLHYHVLVAEPSKKPPVGELILDHILSTSQRITLTDHVAR